MTLAEIWIYPIKSLGGISLKASEIDAFGLKHDRKWMLVDENNNFISQRTHPALNLLSTSISGDSLTISYQSESISISLYPKPTALFNVTIWEDECEAFEIDEAVSSWFSEFLKTPCRLVYLSSTKKRLVNNKYAFNNELTSFTDGFPFLIISTASIQLLNSKLQKSVEMSQFRPNLVIESTEAHIEDTFNEFKIGETVFKAVKPCTRCIVTTIKPNTSTIQKEPLSTLSTYRKIDNNIHFGQNLLLVSGTTLTVGDDVRA